MTLRALVIATAAEKDARYRNLKSPKRRSEDEG
jgi:hypothetical protein